MHVGTLLHRCLDPLLQSIHRTRLATLFAAVAACVSGPALWIPQGQTTVSRLADKRAGVRIRARSLFRRSTPAPRGKTQEEALPAEMHDQNP